VVRRKARLLFKVGWGAGAEDWEIGDRRPICLNDLVIETEDAYVYVALVICRGLLDHLRILGVADKPGNPLKPYQGTIGSLNMVRTHFCERWDINADSTPTNLRESRLRESLHRICPAVELDAPTKFQRWLLSLDARCFRRPNKTLPFAVRRAIPATDSEFLQFEQANHVRPPRELREFWSVTNGASFFGNVIYGTYDAIVGPAGMGTEMVFACRTHIPGQFIFIDCSNREAKNAAMLYEKDVETQDTVRTWHSLRECLETLMEDARVVSQSAEI
jgi:hypothetical protein